MIQSTDKQKLVKEPYLSHNPIHAEYVASESELPYTEWLEAKLEELVPNCMKTWKEDF